MINEILLTVLVMLAAAIVVRHQGSRKQRQRLVREVQPAADRRTAMIVAVALVLLTLTISGVLYYSHWREAHRLFTVTVINSHSGAVQTYHVYRDDIDGRRFRTTDGRLIHLSNAERMEVREGVSAHAD